MFVPQFLSHSDLSRELTPEAPLNPHITTLLSDTHALVSVRDYPSHFLIQSWRYTWVQVCEQGSEQIQQQTLGRWVQESKQSMGKSWINTVVCKSLGTPDNLHYFHL